MGFPALGDQVTLDHAGLHRVGTDVVGLGIGIDGFLAGVLVEEDHGNILAAGLVDDRGAGCGVHQVDGQRLHATGQQDVDLVVLHRLVVLRIVHQQRNVFLLLGDALQRLAHGGHEVVVVFVNGDAHAIGCLGGGSEGGGRQHDSQDSLLHYRDLQFEIARASPIRKKNGPDPEDLLNKPHAARQISAQIRENPIGENPDRTIGRIIHGHPFTKTPGICRAFTSSCPENPWSNRTRHPAPTCSEDPSRQNDILPFVFILPPLRRREYTLDHGRVIKCSPPSS